MPASTDIEKVRLLAGDTGSTQIFTDAEVQFFIDDAQGDSSDTSGGVLRLAAALALRAIAASAAKVEIVRRAGHETTDRKGVVAALLASAEALEAQVYDEPALGYAEIAHTPATAGQIIVNATLRDNA